MIVLVIVAVVLLFVGAPIAVAIAGSTTVAIGTSGIFGLEVVPQQMFIALNSFPLMAIPFFILAGHLMQVGGISERLIEFGSALIGHVTGGLAMAAVLTSMFFAAISGSGAATVAAIGSILIPAMLAHGYERASPPRTKRSPEHLASSSLPASRSSSTRSRQTSPQATCSSQGFCLASS